jgi:hypothetical protein
MLMLMQIQCNYGAKHLRCYIYNHCNMCNIPIYFRNTDIKTLATYL